VDIKIKILTVDLEEVPDYKAALAVNLTKLILGKQGKAC
jgi:hypothetical protein